MSNFILDRVLAIAVTVAAAFFVMPTWAKDTISGLSSNDGQPGFSDVHTSGEAPPPSSGQRAAQPDADGRVNFFIRFHEDSVASYQGDLESFAATSPSVTGRSIANRDTAVEQYESFLADRQSDYLGQLSRVLGRELEPGYQFHKVLNAIVVPLAADEASLVAGLDFVQQVEIEKIATLDTDAGPDLIQAPAFWDGQTLSSQANQGEGVVIGIIDSGIDHDHPSFAAQADDGYAHSNPLGQYFGVCVETPELCNDKLIGSYSFHSTDTDPQDADGHGSHVASTAAGNPVSASYAGLTVDINGVAARANLINYKICSPSCPNASAVAAVEQAIEDGVDVLNYSISGSDDPWNDMVDLAFLDAANAGILVAASAGNDGPGPSTVAKTGPWNASVANSTHDRIFAQGVSLAGGPSGVGGVPGTGPEQTSDYIGDLMWAGDIGNGSNFDGCAAFPADAFDGMAALISRGACAFAQKVVNAVDAGAEYVIVYNNAGGPPIAMAGLEETTVSSVMVSDSDGAAMIATLSGSSAEVTVEAAVSRVTDPGFADLVSAGSSRGPSQFNLLKPDFAAPGTNILAAWYDGSYQAISGTSMASPHAAGAAALVLADRPALTPAEIKSALALTADPDMLKEDGVTASDVFDRGSGRLDLAGAANAGFVMDESYADYVAANPAAGGDPASLNQPSIQEWRCANSCSFERTVRSVADESVEYTISGSMGPDIVSGATPSTFTLAPGASQTIEFSFDVSSAAKGSWAFGEFTIEESGTTVGVSNTRIPVALVPVEPQPIALLGEDAVVSTQERDETTEHSFTVSNIGEYDLEWSAEQFNPRTIESASGKLWGNARSGSSGSINNYVNPANAGYYQSDYFVLYAQSEIDEIRVDGFFLGGDLTEATNLTWAVYADADGVPAGHPDLAPGDALWTFSAEPDAVGVDITEDSMNLDLDAAGAPPLDLAGGKYWLVAFPHLDSFSQSPSYLYAWYNGDRGGGRYTGLLGGLDTWVAASAGRSFELHGSVECSDEYNPWLNLSPSSGLLASGESETVNMSLYSTGLEEGIYESAVCVTSNDPEQPFILLPVQLNVVNLPDASISPTTLTIEVEYGQVTSDALVISNEGLGDLDFSLSSAQDLPAQCTAADSLNWLSADPASGTVSAEGGEETVTIEVDGNSVFPGDYQETVCFETNDEANPYLQVEINLEVTGEAPDLIFRDGFEGGESL